MPRHVDIIACPAGEMGPGNTRNSEGAIIELADGRLLMAYTRFYAGGNDYAAGDIQGKTSDDGGATWSKPFQIESNTALSNVGRLAMMRLKKPFGLESDIPGTLEHFSMAYQFSHLAHIYVEQNDFYNNRLLFKTSTDEGQSWSTPVQINDTGTLAHICQRGDTALVLSTGRIVVPVYGIFGGLCASYMYYSDDYGNTWQRSVGEISIDLYEGGRAFARTDFSEPTVAELRDGRLLCFGRTRVGQIYQSFSGNGGVSWSDAKPSGLASSFSPASLKTIPSTGDLLCVWNHVSGQEIADGLSRMRMSCAVSSNDGQSWSHYQNFDSLDDVGRIEPEGGTVDNIDELQAIQSRLALEEPSKAIFSDEIKQRYPHWGGYKHVDYPSVLLTSDHHVLVMYGVYATTGKDLPLGNKLVVRPVDWLYERCG